MKIKYFTTTTGLQLDQALTPRMVPEDSNQLQDLSLQILAYQSVQHDTSFLSSLSSETALNKAGDIQDQWMQASQATLESLRQLEPDTARIPVSSVVSSPYKRKGSVP